MAFLNASAVRILLSGAAAFAGYVVVRFLYSGYRVRSEMQRLQAQGVPMLPHSWLLGHLMVMGEWRKEVPGDVNIYNSHRWLAANVSKYFPGDTKLPEVVYLDLWPFGDAMAVVTDADLIPQFMQKPDLPKFYVVREFFKPLTGGLDIATNSGPDWKLWRTRFNPSFGPRTIQSLLPELIEEVEVFADGIKKHAGADGKSWGPVFKLNDMTVNLTFDVILRAAVDIRLREQSRETPTALKVAFEKQAKQMENLANASRMSLGIKTPWDHKQIAENNATIASYVMPQISNKIREAEGEDLEGLKESLNKKTSVDSAVAAKLKQMRANGNAMKGASLVDDAEFLEVLIANIKTFLYAGHDTTASTICFMFHELQNHPECLRKLREEHDAILGKDAGNASEVLRESPHLMYQLPYTTGVIKETLRLHPLAATLRQPPDGFALVTKDTNRTYPVGKFALWVGAPVVNTNDKHWVEPYKFLPERWIVPEDHPLYPPSRDAWASFSIGPRNCIGMEIAMMELRLVSVLTVRQFDIEEAWDEWDRLQGDKATPNHKADGKRLYWVGMGTVHPKDGMPVHARLAQP